MKPGRNEPCPCGSGMKYKKCCYSKEKSISAGNTVNSQSVQDNPRDSLEDQELLLGLMNTFRTMILDKKPHIKEYYKTRKLHAEIVNAMIQYHDAGKFRQKASTESISQEKHQPILYLLESEFDLETRVGAQGFYDVAIYKPSSNMNCITEDFIQNQRYRKPEKVELLYSMLDSKLGLFEILDTDLSEGYAYLKDVFTGAEFTLTDIGLSGDRNYNQFYIYTRIITYHGISFGTGLNFVFTKTDNFIKDHIQHHKKNFTPMGELVRFTQLYNHYSDAPDVKVVPNTWK